MISILLIYSLFFQALAQSNPGQILLNSYTCDSRGANTNSQLNSISNLRLQAQALTNDPKCMNLGNRIHAIPTIDSVLESVRLQGVAQEIKAQEEIINQAIIDLKQIDESEINQDNQHLYPDPDILRSSIQQANTKLTILKAQLSADEIKNQRDQYIQGIQELNQVGTLISEILNEDNGECMNRFPEIKTGLTSSLMGISGFFMAQPVGVATVMSGKLVQNGLRIFREAKRNKKEQKIFGELNAISVSTGLSCALESMGKQNCNLNREFNAFKELVRLRRMSNLNIVEKIDESLGGCIGTYSILPDIGNQSITPIIDWVIQGETLDVGLIQSPENQKRTTAYGEFNSAATAYQNDLASIRSDLLAITNLQTKKAKRRENILNFYQKHKGYDQQGSYSQKSLFSNEIASSVLTKEEKDRLFLRIISDPGKSEQDIVATFQDLKNDYQAFLKKQIEQNRQVGVSNIDALSAYQMYTIMTNGIDPSVVMNSSNYGETTKKITELLMDEKTVFNNQRNIANLDIRMRNELKSSGAPERKVNLIRSFYDETDKNKSPIHNLKRLRAYLNNLPQMDSTVIKLLGIDALKKDINNILAKADEVYDNYNNDNFASSWDELITDTTKLVGEQNNLALKISAINKEIHIHNTKSLQEKLKNLPDDQKDNYNDALFLMNQSILESAIKIDSVPSDQVIDYKTAQDFSKANIKAFEELYSDDIMRTLRSTSIDDWQKNKLCVHLLALPSIDQEYKKMCKDAKVEDLFGENLVRFSDYVDLPLEKRSCAYQDFRVKDQMNLNN